MAANEDKKKDGIISLDAARKSRKEETARPVQEEEFTIRVPAVIDRIAESIKEYKEELEKKGKGQKIDITKGEFICLLSGISTCRRMPGIPKHMGYKGLYKCQSEEDIQAARTHLEEVYHISDEESMKKALWGICVNHDYRQFESFWDGKPVFDANVLKPKARTAFESGKACAEKLSPIVGKQGFLAWDINEQIGMCRKVFACGLITEEEFTQLTVPLAKRALRVFSTWEEYAVSCLCGSAYFGFCNHDTEQNQWDFFQLNKTLVDKLLEADGAWGKSRFKPL